ncbi:MAG: FHA domain-containing protein [Gemmataceae bacterium]
MSFRLFIYYCALVGGWAAFLTWGLVQLLGIGSLSSPLIQATAVGGLLGTLVAAGVGLVDARLAASGDAGKRVAVCAGLGLIGGAFGGLVGQVLNSAVGVPIFVGWMLAGVLVGASVGAFDVLRAVTSRQDSRASRKKLLNGIYGGLLGGLIGGLPYTVVRAAAAGDPGTGLRRLADALPNSSLAVSLVVLGACIGLMIGLAQVVLKEAWLKVEEGFRAGRELMLTREETTIGRAEGCDLGLFGDNSVEKTHARIIQKNHRYLLAHAGEGGQTFVNDRPIGAAPVTLRSGDAIRIGKCLLRFGERQKSTPRPGKK